MSVPAVCPGSLQIWYHLQTDRSPDMFSPVLGNLADGRLHRIRIHRVGKNLYVQVSRTETLKGHSGNFLTFPHRKFFAPCRYFCSLQDVFSPTDPQRKAELDYKT